MEIISGKELSESIREEIRLEVDAMKSRGEKAPHLAAILVGEDPASQTYVSSKVKNCEKVGFESSLVQLPSDTTQEQLIEQVKQLNDDSNIDGYIVQLPLPDHLDEDEVNAAIDYQKDVDGFHPVNVGRMVLGLPSYLPATPNGIMEMLKRKNIDTQGKHCVVIGRSNIVGSPMSILLAKNAQPGNCTVTLCHSRTTNLKELCLQADIVVVAIGKKLFLKADYVKEGAVVVDVGIHRIEDSSKKSGFRLCGDVDYDTVAPKCSFITPVPGGVGPMTIASLLQNTLKAAKGEIYPKA